MKKFAERKIGRLLAVILALFSFAPLAYAAPAANPVAGHSYIFYVNTGMNGDKDFMQIIMTFRADGTGETKTTEYKSKSDSTEEKREPFAYTVDSAKKTITIKDEKSTAYATYTDNMVIFSALFVTCILVRMD